MLLSQCHFVLIANTIAFLEQRETLLKQLQVNAEDTEVFKDYYYH